MYFSFSKKKKSNFPKFIKSTLNKFRINTPNMTLHAVPYAPIALMTSPIKSTGKR